jgi:alpha-galactosidase/6-phospho-beta-glucosidase family protein
MPRLQPHLSAGERANIRNSVTRLMEFYREFGVLLFSTEPEGLWHLRYEQTLAESLAKQPPRSRAEVLKGANQERKARIDTDRHFQSYLDQDLTDQFWQKEGETHPLFRRAKCNVIARILKGAAGSAPVRVVTSMPNNGAIAGFKDRAMVEYSQILHRRTIRPEGRYELPDVVQGVVGALAAHQTMLADAIGTNDPRLFAHALLTYPVRPYSNALRGLCRALLKVNAEEIPKAFRRTADYL